MRNLIHRLPRSHDKKGGGGTFDIKFTRKSSKNLLNSSICKKYRIYGKFNMFSKKIESGGHLLIY